MAFDLITGIILLAIGIILYAIRNVFPDIGAKIAYALGLILIVIGIVVIVGWLLLTYVL